MPHLQAIQQAEHGTGVTPEPFEICVSTGSQVFISKRFLQF
jgi:hypothetical protein